MEKKLPKVYHNTINKELNNNEDVYYSANKGEDIKMENSKQKKDISVKKSIKQKINEIFASPNYIYKASVIIKTNDGVISKRIIGRNQKYLITMENETILIDDIQDINIK